MGPPVARESEYLYVVATPRDRLLEDDKVIGCDFYEEDKKVDPKIGWIGPHGNMPLDDLIDTHVDERAVEAILAAAH